MLVLKINWLTSPATEHFYQHQEAPKVQFQMNEWKNEWPLTGCTKKLLKLEIEFGTKLWEEDEVENIGRRLGISLRSSSEVVFKIHVRDIFLPGAKIGSMACLQTTSHIAFPRLQALNQAPALITRHYASRAFRALILDLWGAASHASLFLYVGYSTNPIPLADKNIFSDTDLVMAGLRLLLEK